MNKQILIAMTALVAACSCLLDHSPGMKSSYTLDEVQAFLANEQADCKELMEQINPSEKCLADVASHEDQIDHNQSSFSIEDLEDVLEQRTIHCYQTLLICNEEKKGDGSAHRRLAEASAALGGGNQKRMLFFWRAVAAWFQQKRWRRK